MKNLAFSLMTLLPFSATADAACWDIGQPSIKDHPEFPSTVSCTNCTTNNPGVVPDWEQPEHHPHFGSDFGSELGAIRSGETLGYAGSASPGTALNTGIPFDVPGSMTGVESELHVSINWQPVMQEYCSKHKTVFSKGRKCVEKKGYALPTSFSLEVLNANGYRKTYNFQNVNSLQNGIINVPRVVCEGPMTGYEVRIRDLTGGTVDFKLNKVIRTKYFQY